MIRTFIAVELPPSMQQPIASIQQELDLKGLKLVKPELVHLTLKFLGDIPETRVEPIAAALSEMDCGPFDARVSGVGVFPNPSYIKVVWLGAQGEFDKLHARVEQALQEFRFKKDRGKFTPHATLARVKYLDNDSKARMARVLAKLQDIDLGGFRVERIALKQSTLTPQGPIYKTLKEILL